MEFESVSLRVEKVVAAGSEGVVNVRPLAPGRYEFFDDFHQEDAAFWSCSDAQRSIGRRPNLSGIESGDVSKSQIDDRPE